MRELPYSNYPAGVTDNDDHFNSDPDGTEPRISEPLAKRIDSGPEHSPDCECEECVCPF
jgi:hypothetical protein